MFLFPSLAAPPPACFSFAFPSADLVRRAEVEILSCLNAAEEDAVHQLRHGTRVAVQDAGG